MEKVDVLLPPKFEKSGVIRSITEAWDNCDWIGTFNLWIVQRNPVPALIYQLRSPNSGWAPNKLDVSVGGHYSAGEEMYDGLREAKEEIGKEYNTKEIVYLGRKINVSPDTEGRERRNVVSIFLVEDNCPISSFVLQKKELSAICACPIDELIQTHEIDGHKFEVNGLDPQGNEIRISVNRDSFPYNYDNYHYKIALMADRFIKGEKKLIY